MVDRHEATRCQQEHEQVPGKVLLAPGKMPTALQLFAVLKCMGTM
jgi:hypothetical protein